MLSFIPPAGSEFALRIGIGLLGRLPLGLSQLLGQPRRPALHGDAARPETMVLTAFD